MTSNSFEGTVLVTGYMGSHTVRSLRELERVEIDRPDLTGMIELTDQREAILLDATGPSGTLAGSLTWARVKSSVGESASSARADRY